MIYTSVIGVLHGEEPLEVEHQLVQQVWCGIAALRDASLQLGKVLGHLFVGSKHQTDAEG